MNVCMNVYMNVCMNGYLDDGLGEGGPCAQQVVHVVPVLLQGSQLLLQPGLGLLVPHGEQLPAHFQRLEVATLVALGEQVHALETHTQTHTHTHTHRLKIHMGGTKMIKEKWNERKKERKKQRERKIETGIKKEREKRN